MAKYRYLAEIFNHNSFTRRNPPCPLNMDAANHNRKTRSSLLRRGADGANPNMQSRSISQRSHPEAAVDIKPPSLRSHARMKAVTRAPTAASGAPSAGVLVLAVFADRGQQ